ncbi:serine/threonine protein kinase [Blautia liquoris]|uniref:non-specific serine/threonine protein kinase n=1 Tax=Blautia liquoris TaxID=2779518 RepID=A0A7M2RFK5_9FIRM|nr:serine/threonine-protein kinase [Blautia liquoris]QOV18110.1 serine/threonine protein kinase [Blautia liquoris]
MIGNKYLLIEIIGKGGFGEVCLAVDLNLGKEWAIKRLLNRDDDGIHEAAMMKELDYPTLPRVVDLIREEDGVYLVMDYLRGRSLGDILRSGRKFSQKENLEIGIELAKTLEYLHSKEPPVLYQDMKPDNILLTPEGQIKLVDFGLASWMKLDSPGENPKGGTRGYAAPEQYGGICDQTTDLFGLGRTLQLVSGGKGSAAFRRMLRKSTRHKKSRRFQSAREVRIILEKIYENKRQNQKVTTWILGALSVLLAAGISFALLTESEQQRYYQLINEASQAEQEDSAVSLDKTVGIYKKASRLCPDKQESYLKLLEFSEENGQTQPAVDWILSMWVSYPKETKNHTEVKKELGFLYFCGNSLDPKFNKDYNMAAKIFDDVAKKEKDPDGWKKLGELSKSLEQFGTDIDWKKIQESLEYFKQYGERMLHRQDLDYICELYLVCGSTYLSEASFLKNENINPYQEGISCYEKAYDTAMLLREDMRMRQETLESLASACYMTGILKENMDQGFSNPDSLLQEDTYLEKSIYYGKQLLKIADRRELKQRILLREATARNFQGNIEEAQKCYENFCQQYPHHMEGICSYTEFLIETRQPDRAREMIQQAASIPGADENRNYQILKERLEVLS